MTPRDTVQPEPRDIRPVVAMPSRGVPLAVVIAAAIFAGLLLFLALNARRQALSAPAISQRGTDLPVSAAPPPLYLPPPIPQRAPPPVATPAPTAQPSPVPPVPVVVRQPPPSYVPPVQAPTQAAPAVPVQRNAGGPALVVDTTQASTPSTPTTGPRPGFNPLGLPSQAGATTERARAGMFANRATTVPQGTLIPVVLETGYDSTRPGYARALVQRDIRGFDGSQVLIPRGSRLVGEYGADTAPGQNRAGIVWSRLIRPDGMTIEIGSPAADTVGRGGVRANVNSHFWERFGSAILQSSLDVGVNLASRAGNGSVVVLPGGGQALTGRFFQPNVVRPTLSVRPGTSVSVFVARDLDFSTSREP